MPWWRKFLAQFSDVLVLLLLGAAAVSAILWWLEHAAALPYEALAIAAIVLLNAVMGYVDDAHLSRPRAGAASQVSDVSGIRARSG